MFPNHTGAQIQHIQVSSSNPCNAPHPPYNARKKDAQVEHLGLIKTALRNNIQTVNFADLIKPGGHMKI